MSSWRVIQGDCVEQMRELDEASVDAVVCDPPYGLEFMGKEWDRLGATSEAQDDVRGWTNGGGEMVEGAPGPFAGGGQRIRYGATARAMQEWHQVWAAEALRVLKPGGHLLAFGGTRTYHRLACAVEDAGFEIRDTICWLYGSGFPKSLDVSKAIDRAAGAEREVVGKRQFADGTLARDGAVMGQHGRLNPAAGNPLMTAPATPEAERWQGWGTALKPAHEPIVVARKPLAGTVAQNCLEHGTGALNVDGCRVGMSDEDRAVVDARSGRMDPTKAADFLGALESGREGDRFTSNEAGRWPANVVLDDEAARMLDEQTGEVGGGFGRRGAAANAGDEQGLFGIRATGEEVGYGDSGGASRFFYCAKSSRAERNAGLEGFEEGLPRAPNGSPNAVGTTRGSLSQPRANVHPTVKPISLMRWLVRLVTPPDGTVLDPFTGSGTTGCAAVLEGFDFVGIEREPEYADICEARIAWWDKHRGEGEVEEILAAGLRRAEAEARGQWSFFDLGEDAA